MSNILNSSSNFWMTKITQNSNNTKDSTSGDSQRKGLNSQDIIMKDTSSLNLKDVTTDTSSNFIDSSFQIQGNIE